MYRKQATLRRPTRNDVARSAQVSGATVSRVLSGRSDLAISEETRARVLAAAQQLGYRPNQAARSLVTGRSHTIGLWTVDSFTPFYSDIARRMTELAVPSRYRVAVQHMASYQAAPEATDLPQFDGILTCDLRHPSYIASLRALQAPLVFMGVHYPAEGDYVGVDLYAGAVQAMEHLLSQGGRRIAFMAYTGGYSLEDPRCRAYATLLQQAGLETDILYTPRHGRAAARQAIGTYARERGCPEAIFCFNDEVALGCYRGLYDLGVRVPEDVALVGCDGIEATEYLECPLTTIVQPVEAMCALAWQYLAQRIADPTTAPQQAILQSQLVIRESSYHPAVRPRRHF